MCRADSRLIEPSGARGLLVHATHSTTTPLRLLAPGKLATVSSSEQPPTSALPEPREAPAPALSVVIPTYNGERFLGVQLSALAGEALDGGFEVIVSDNGSADGTISLAESFADRIEVRVVDASARRGQTFARNTGATAAHGGLLVFLDQDDKIAPGYLESMATALASSPAVAARMDVQELNSGSMSEAREIVQTEALPLGTTPWAYGCTLGIRREVFEGVGGFDESLYDASEDIDLCRRLHDRNVAIQYVPSALLHYRFPETLGGFFRQGRRYAIAQGALDRRQLKHAPPFSVWRWARSTLGPLRLIALGKDRGSRARGIFLLGRRVGTIEGELRARTWLRPYPRRR